MLENSLLDCRLIELVACILKLSEEKEERGRNQIKEGGIYKPGVDVANGGGTQTGEL